MGYSRWSDDFYRSRQTEKARAHVATFEHDADIRAGRTEAKVHPKLDPKGVTRESRDSKAHPLSVPIGVVLDVTGSMRTVPMQIQKELPKLNSFLTSHGYVTDPQILFGAVGDFHSDRVPLQMGQFESGVEMDDDITRLYLEGGGGPSYTESYEEALYFFARHTVTDAWEKRQRKGYLFIVGDEHPYPTLSRAEVREVFGDDIPEGLRTDELATEVGKRYFTFFIIPNQTNHFNEPSLLHKWQQLLGEQNVLRLSHPEGICELIGSTIGLVEGDLLGDISLSDKLTNAGVNAKVAESVSDALDPLRQSLMKVVKGTPPRKKAKVARL